MRLSLRLLNFRRHCTSNKKPIPGVHMKKAAATLAIALGLVTAASSIALAAKGDWKKNHPRRAEVVGRAKHEEKKNNDAAEDGKITSGQAARLNKQDERIKRQEQRQARRNGGHITKGEQAKDNREENRVNQERNNMEKRDASKTTAPAATSPEGNGP